MFNGFGFGFGFFFMIFDLVFGLGFSVLLFYISGYGGSSSIGGYVFFEDEFFFLEGI